MENSFGYGFAYRIILLWVLLRTHLYFLDRAHVI